MGASASTPIRHEVVEPEDDFEEIKAMVQEGIDDFEAGRSVDGEAFMDALIQEKRAAKTP